MLLRESAQSIQPITSIQSIRPIESVNFNRINRIEPNQLETVPRYEAQTRAERSLVQLQRYWEHAHVDEYENIIGYKLT